MRIIRLESALFFCCALAIITGLPLMARVTQSTGAEAEFTFHLSGRAMLSMLNVFGVAHHNAQGLWLGPSLPSAAITFPFALWGAVCLWRKSPRAARMLTLTFIFLTIAPLIFCHWSNHWLPGRYWLPALAPFVALLAEGLLDTGIRIGRIAGDQRLFRFVLIWTPLAIFTLISAVYIITQPHTKPDWRSAVEWLEHAPAAPCIACGFITFDSTRYYRDHMAPQMELHCWDGRPDNLSRAHRSATGDITKCYYISILDDNNTSPYLRQLGDFYQLCWADASRHIGIFRIRQ